MRVSEPAIRRLCVRRSVGRLCLALLCLLLPDVLQAQQAPQAADEWEMRTVRELMQQDLRRAAGDASRQSVRPDNSDGARSAPTVRPVLAPRLVALYGVGRALMAEVQVGRESYLYVRGQVFPAGYAGDHNVYQLRGMNGACVQLERGEDKHSLCLRMLLGEARP